jgi:hypothetical protein
MLAKQSFLDIDVGKSVTLLLEKLSETLEKIHANFTTKIETAVLERVVTHYMQAFLIFADKKKFKKEDVFSFCNNLILSVSNFD